MPNYMRVMIDELKENAENMVYQTGQELDYKALHGLALEVLLGLVDVKKFLEQENVPYSMTKPARGLQIEENNHVVSQEAKEVAKVKNRLQRWANNPKQINSQILTAYLQLQQSGISSIREKQLKDQYVKLGGDEARFYKNYPQMKSISERNHGKVFDENNGVISIWARVEDLVDTFFKAVIFSDQ